MTKKMRFLDIMKGEKDIIKLLEDKSCDLQKICRLCLKDNLETGYSIYESYQDSLPIFESIMLLTKLKIEQNEEKMPNTVCEECKNELMQINCFRIKCEHSDSVLRKVLIKESTENGFLDVTLLKKEENIEITVKEEQLFDNGDDDAPIDDAEHSVVVKRKHKKLKKKCVSKDLPVVDVIANIKHELDEDFSLNDEECGYSDDDVSPAHITSDQLTKVACSICNKLLKTKRSLVSHMHKYHNDKKSVVRVPYDIQGYGNDRKFLCTFCDYTAKRKQGIVGHIRTHTGEKPFKCDECTMHFPTSSALCNHKKVHSDQKNHTCHQCGKQFRLKSKYEVHKSVHSNERKYKCDICNKMLKSKITLQTHIFRHNNIKNYSCEACGATFVTCSELISHSKSHNGEKKFKCTICAFMTQTKATLEAHLLRHTGERKFECTYCDAKCYTYGALRNHMVKHTKEKKYACMFCEQKFAHSSSLNRHMLKSHEKKCKWMDLVDRRIVK